MLTDNLSLLSRKQITANGRVKRLNTYFNGHRASKRGRKRDSESASARERKMERKILSLNDRNLHVNVVYQFKRLNALKLMTDLVQKRQ